MGKAMIYYHTGTGNTGIVAQMIARELVNLGMEVELQEAIMPFEPLDPTGFDLVGFGYPIHAFNTPKFFLKFVKLLPRVEKIPAFIFKTSGEPFHYNMASSFTLVNILKRKGFIPGLEHHLLMPYNIMFRYPEPLVKQMYLHNEQLTKLIAWKLANNQFKRLWFDPYHVILMYIFRLQWLGARINRPFIKAERDKCIKCGLCAKDCPSETIEMVDGFPKFVNRCSMCMRCVMECPTDAINFGIFNHWKVPGKYDFKTILGDETISSSYVNNRTKGYFRLFRKYFKKSQRKIDMFLKNEGNDQNGKI